MSRASSRFVPAEVNSNVTQWIAQRTGSRVRDLRVETDHGKVLIYGHAGSHYVRQLALAAAMEACDPNRVEVHIDVN